MITVTITNRQKTLPIDRRRCAGRCGTILEDAGIQEGLISVAVVDDATIARLHGKFLSDPQPTDVLSFLLERSAQTLEGEIVLSADAARANATRYQWTAAEELLLYAIHGALHLVGCDNATPRKRGSCASETRVSCAGQGLKTGGHSCETASGLPDEVRTSPRSHLSPFPLSPLPSPLTSPSFRCATIDAAIEMANNNATASSDIQTGNGAMPCRSSQNSASIFAPTKASTAANP